jgi:hypothetical protein
VIAAVSIVPKKRQADRGQQDRPDLDEARGQAALEQDQRERDDADRLRHLVVVEGQPAQPVGAQEHADAEEEHEAGHPHAHRHERRQEACGEQRRADQDELAGVHAATTMPRRGR